MWARDIPIQAPPGIARRAKAAYLFLGVSPAI